MRLGLEDEEELTEKEDDESCKEAAVLKPRVEQWTM